MPIPQQDERYTYADYCTWDDNGRWELIDGAAYAMSPAPTRTHQQISGELYRQLANFLKGKPCKVYHAPFDVRLNAGSEDNTVIQPDLVVVCDSSKLDEKGCKGAPDLVVEVLSPTSARTDKLLKFQKYQRAGVREYWIVDPETKAVQVCVLRDEFYLVTMYADTDTAPVSVLSGCEINLQDVFAE